MAGDWIPIRCTLTDDPAVIAIAAATGIDECGVVGRLVKLWSWANQHTADGNAPGVTEVWIDRYVCVAGFARAMSVAGWLTLGVDSTDFPRFDRWNSQGAKKRVATNRRVANHRRNAPVTPDDPDGNAASVTGALPKPLPENRRKEKSKYPPQPPAKSRGGVCVDDPPDPTKIGPKPAAVTEHWNAHPGLLPCVPTDPNRDRMIRTWATTNELWVKHWSAVIAFMGRTPFYCGGGERRWRPTLGWLLKDDNFPGVVERMLADCPTQSAIPADPRQRFRLELRDLVAKEALTLEQAERQYGGPLDDERSRAA